MRVEKNLLPPPPSETSRAAANEKAPKKGMKVSADVIHHQGPSRQGDAFMSERDLRQKIASKAIENGAPFKRPQSARPPFPLDDAPDEVKDQALKNPEKVMSDVGLNDPNDPTTKEKLKAALGSGTFQFKQNERSVLEKIIG